ncbi:MAG: carbon-nitrogen hydrolase family protein [Chloroflexi bacterium]|nr:carbon-nitrogen hydrolase family protein [Chloroflexota bacterium]
MADNVRVALIQARPVYYDLNETVSLACSLLSEAAGQGAQLASFGETFFPGYPAWLDYALDYARWDHPPTKQLYARLVANSMTIDGPEMRKLQEAARDNEVVLVLGINERVSCGRGNRSLYNSIVTIDADGSIVNHHRKLSPTYTEQLVWAPGDGAGLRAVATAAGRVGGLICWEHWMPHARQAMHISNEAIHIALWPAVKESHQIASRHYAFEGRTFVLAIGNIMPASDFPAELDLPERLRAQPESLLLNGGSAVIAPDGNYLIKPVYGEETILYADLDLNRIAEEQMTLDVTGGYARDDIFTFEVNRRRLE